MSNIRLPLVAGQIIGILVRQFGVVRVFIGGGRPGWRCRSGRPLGIRLDGTVEAPAGLETPRAGKNLGTVNSLSYAVTSPGGLVSELALGLDGCVPSWILSRWSSRMGVIPSPTRTTAYALTVSGSTATPDTATAVQARLPFKLGADATIKAIHFRNYNDRSGLAYAGALSFAGVYFGSHAQDATGELTGNFTAAPTQVAGAATTPADGSEYKISGLNIAVIAGTDYLLSYGYTGAAQNNHSAVGGCWRNATPANASATTATQTISRTAPLDVWLEIEVAGNVPVVAYMGDSLSCGVSSQLPVYHSYPVKHAQMNGHIPAMYTHSGSAMTTWTSAGVGKYTKWSALTKPDALVISLGKNDLSTAGDAATMRARFNTLYPVMTEQISKNLYLTTILPDLNDATATGQIRRDWNAILKSELPGNAIAAFNMASAVTTAAGGLDPLADSGDGVHLNKSGYARTATSITQPLHR